MSKTDLKIAPLKPMMGCLMRIHLKDDVPFVIHTTRPIPFAFQSQVKEELDSGSLGELSPMPGISLLNGAYPMVGVRITVDLTKLNS